MVVLKCSNVGKQNRMRIFFTSQSGTDLLLKVS